MNTQAILDFEDFCKIDLESIGKMAPIIYGIVKKIVPFPDNLKSIKELESIYTVCRIEEINNYKNDLVRKAVRKLTRNRAKKNTTLVTGSTKIDTRTIAAAYSAIIDSDIKNDLENLTRGSSYEKEFVYVPVQKYGDVPPYRETINHVNSIAAIYNQLLKSYNIYCATEQ